jgi:hypothetical protein
MNLERRRSSENKRYAALIESDIEERIGEKDASITDRGSKGT